jgi:NAD(P)-dependent dehydrogenase (short-subunit alcohol dehydrogenase family)
LDLKGKNILITGASKGLGKATAEMLIKAGANVAITARSSEKIISNSQRNRRISNSGRCID